MKQIMSILLASIMWLGARLYAPAVPAEITAAPDTMVIAVELPASTSVLELGTAYLLDGESIGCGGVKNARQGVPLDTAYPCTFILDPMSFGDREAAGHAFTLVLTVTDAAGQPYEAGSYTCEMHYGEVHQLMLKADETGYRLHEKD